MNVRQRIEAAEAYNAKMNKPQIAFTEVLGQVIRQRREAMAQRQEDLAPALDITPSAWSRIEAGKTSMTVVQLRRIAQALGTNAWMLLKDAETVAQKIPNGSPSVEVVDEPPKSGQAAGWFISGAAVGTLVTGVLALCHECAHAELCEGCGQIEDRCECERDMFGQRSEA